MTLIPPYRYAIVEDGLHRSAYPVERNLRFLKRLQLKTIVSLVPQPPSAALLAFCETNQVNSIHLKVDIYKEKNPLTDQAVVQAIEILINPVHHPLLLHCMNGAEVTGIVIMCLRKLQMFTTTFATIEFSRFLREGIIEQDQTDFLDSFGAVIELPPTLPLWLWQGKPLAKQHPTIKLKKEEPRNVPKRKSELKKKVNDALLRGEIEPEEYDSLALEALALESTVDKKLRNGAK